jgi:hypothetical protein
MKMISLLALVLLFGCSKKTELILQKQKVVGLENVETFIEDIKVVDWKVGDFRAHTLSKGFLLMVKLPHLSTSQIEQIVGSTSIDSWVLRFHKKTDHGSRILGTTYVPFVREYANGGTRTNNQEGIYTNIYYAPAALSGRLENLKCPAMNHRRVIDRWSMNKSESPKKVIISFSNQLSETPAISGIMPEIFNGDMSLIGEYFVEIAFYSSKSKILYSDFVQIGNTVIISAEKEIEVKSCDNFEVPAPDYDHKEKMKQFKFK